jgi:hypothetical protein
MTVPTAESGVRDPGPDPATPHTLPTRRLVAIALLFALIVGGHAIVMISRADPWPFSSYPMYSHVRGTTWQQWVIHLYDDAGRRIDYPAELLPRPICINSGLNRLAFGPNADPDRVERLLKQLCDTYETNRQRRGLQDQLPTAAFATAELLRWGRDPDDRFSMALQERELRFTSTPRERDLPPMLEAILTAERAGGGER